MADKISINLGQLEGVVNIKTLLDEQKLNSIVKTIENALSNVDIKKYLKGTDDLLNDLQIAFSNFNKEQSKVNAKELLNVSNVLKALGVDISDVIPEFDKINSAISQAGKLAHAMDGVINVKQFKDAAVAIAELSENGVNVAEMFERLGTSADTNALKNQIDDLSDSLENAGRKNEKLRDRNSSLLDELYKVKSGSRVTELEEQLEELRSLRDRTVEEFKQSLGYFDLDEHQFDLYPYIKNIEEGVYSAKGALADFKSDYKYLFEDAFNNKQNTGTDQFDKLESSLAEVLKVVQETSAGIKELQNQIDMFSVPGIEDDFKGSDESLKQILNLFGQINDSLSSLRSIISDVGDGEEFSPLLKTIKEITTAVDTLSKSVSNIGLNVNIESGGMDQKLLSSLDAKKQSLLSAYKTQFNAMRAFKPSGATVAMANPENRSRIAALNKKINNFDGGASTDKIDQRITAYKEVIKLMKEVSQLSYGKDIYSDMDSSFKNAVSSATGQVTRVQNELKKANTDVAGLENIFGSQDLSKVVEQLGRIADQFENIAKASSEFKAKFADGIKVESSVQEIETLTKKVKELEKEISKLKTGSKTNISTPKNTTPDTAGASADDSKVSIKGEADKLKETAQNATEAANAKLKFVDANKKVKDSAKDSADAIQGESDSFKNVNTDPYSTYVQNVYKAWQQADKINDALSETQQKFQNIESTFGKSATGGSRFEELFPGVTAQIKTLDNELTQGNRTLKSYASAIDKLLVKNPESFLKNSESAIQKAEKSLNNLTVPSNLTSEFSNVKTEVESLNEQLRNNKISISDYKQSVSEKISDFGSAIKEQKTALEKTLSEINTLIGKVDYNVKTGKPVNGMRSSDYSTMMDKYKAELEELRTLQATVSKQDYVSAAQLKQFDDLRKKLKDSETSFKTLSAAEKGSDSLSRAKLYSKIGEYLQKNSGMTKEFKTQLKSLQKQLENDGPNANVKNLTDQFIRLQSQIREAGQEGRSFLDVLKDKAFYGFAGQLSTYFGINDFVRYIGEGINTVRELDTAMTEMRKVSDESVTSLKNYQKATFDVADAVGTTAIQIQNSTADWKRLGYGLDEASKLAEISNLYKNVGDMDINEATEHMISSVQAWKSEFSSTVDTAEAIANRYNKIGNEFAISSADIGEAMETSAAALKAGGNTLNESLGLITAGNVIQQDASTVSSAMKILSLRIRGAKADLESMGESTDDLADSTSKLRDELKALTGVDIMLDENTFKSTAQIIQEIGKNWSKMTDVSQAAALEKLAGKNRASTVAGLIENYETIGKVIEAAEQADNSALEENEKFLESIDGRVQKLQNRMQEFWATVIDTDTVKTGISLLTDLVSGATALVDKLGTLPTALGALGAALSVKNVGGRKMFRLLNMPTA